MSKLEQFLPVLLSLNIKQQKFDASFDEINPTKLCIRILNKDYPFNNNNILLIVPDNLPIETAYDVFIALSKYKKESQKKIYCYSSVLDISSILIMSVCDKKYAPPLQGPLYLGIHTLDMEIKDKLIKLFNINITGTYGENKSFPKYFNGNFPEESNELERKNIYKLNNEVFKLINHNLGKTNLIKSWFASSEELAELNIIDDTLYLEELYSKIVIKKAGKLLSVYKLFAKALKRLFFLKKIKIPIIEYTQNISDIILQPEKQYLKLIKKVSYAKPKIVIIILDSSGGDLGLAHRQAYLMKNYLPNSKIIVYAKKAISSGYFFACNADKIIVNRFGRLGGIGNFSINLNLTELLQNIGIELQFIPSNYISNIKFLNFGNDNEYLTEIQKKNRLCNSAFWNLLESKRPIQRVDELKKSSIFSGEESVSFGLADKECSLIELFEDINKEYKYKFEYFSVKKYKIYMLLKALKHLYTL